MVSDKNHPVIKSVDDLEINSEFKLTFKDGTVGCRVIDKEKKYE